MTVPIKGQREFFDRANKFRTRCWYIFRGKRGFRYAHNTKLVGCFGHWLLQLNICKQHTNERKLERHLRLRRFRRCFLWLLKWPDMEQRAGGRSTMRNTLGFESYAPKAKCLNGISFRSRLKAVDPMKQPLISQRNRTICHTFLLPKAACYAVSLRAGRLFINRCEYHRYRLAAGDSKRTHSRAARMRFTDPAACRLLPGLPFCFLACAIPRARARFPTRRRQGGSYI